jgi:hypothetical protein
MQSPQQGDNTNLHLQDFWSWRYTPLTGSTPLLMRTDKGC